ncbi:MAG: yehU 12 [Herbinix sp.]|jgi:two-component system sensor histidine kinase YesM|nr:yehU 12 [Herbinix sp.]
MKKLRSTRKNKVSLQTKLIRLFLMTSAIPILFISFFSYYNISNTLKKNTEELTISNLEQTSKSLNIWLESYEDILYQIYTNDDVVTLVDNLNQGKDVAVTKNQLRRFLQGILYTKEYIRSITIITSGGMLISYDQMTAVSNVQSWIENFSLSQDDLYNQVSGDNTTHIFPTQYGTSFANIDNYLFHIAHRLIDYKKLNKKNGIAIVSIDEKLLREACLSTSDTDNKMSSFNFIVDDSGRVISYIDQNKLTYKVIDSSYTLAEREKTYLDFVSEDMKVNKDYLSVYVYHDEALNWDIINITNQRDAISKLSLQQRIVIFVSAASLFVAIILTILLSRRLVSSVKKVVTTMQVVSTGDLKSRVEIERKMPIEVEDIALQFNDMLGILDAAMKKEKEAGERQLQAEIKALEAQINPHFLYNTLDTINWMAIDKEDYDISNAISSLAQILRYAITNSNAMVEIRQELEWLKNYVYLQQIRLKNSFRYEVDADPEIMNCKIHKLILQPFIENAIIHGFEGLAREHVLSIKLESKSNVISITIRDNGKGMEPALVDEINNKVFRSIDRGSHIGMENVISRMHMYYGNEASVRVRSILREETEVILEIPRRI